MAVKSYKKGTATQLSTNFKSTEFDCHGSGCCSSTLIDENLVNYVQKIRNHFGKPVNISSAYRCNIHNKNVGGATNSRHRKGEAADIYIKDVAPIEIAQYAETIGILGIGLYETNKDGFFVHIDTRDKKAFWYGQAQEPRDTFLEKEEVKLDTSKINTAAADPKVMWNYFKSQGLNDYGVAGLMGNLFAESGLRPVNLQNSHEKKLGMTDAEYTLAVDTGIYTNFIKDGAGYGLAQWTYWSLKQDMLNYFQKRNKSIGDLDTQMEFLVHQLSTGYKAVWEILKNATSVLEASNAVLLKFERPADQSISVQNKRAGYGQKYYDDYAKKTIEVIPEIQLPQESDSGSMKYSKDNQPLVCMQTQSTCYKNTSKMNVKGVLWHSTGANNPNLKRYVQPSDNAPDKEQWLELLGKNQYNNDWNHISRQAGLNCWIGKLADGTVTTVQTMPWDYKPWGCGSSSKGSCNNGWIQFEICEDGLNDKEYFEKVYKEACEITAYLCKMFNLDPNGVVNYNGVEVPVILCHADSYKLRVGSNHADVNHWFPKFGKSMETARQDVAKLMGKITISKEEPSQEDVKEPEIITTVNGLKEGDEAQLIAGATYTSGVSIPEWVLKSKVYIRKIGPHGTVVFSTLRTGAITGVTASKNLVPWIEKVEAPKPTPNSEITKDAKVKLIPGATYANGGKIPNWVFDSVLYAREIRNNGNIVISTQKTGAITGVVNKKNLQLAELTPKYMVQVIAPVVNIRAEPSTASTIVGQTQAGDKHYIYDIQGYWGRTKSGWIYMTYTKKVLL